jgi:hypothetical protein
MKLAILTLAITVPALAWLVRDFLRWCEKLEQEPPQ